MNRILTWLLSLPKTLFFNFYMFPIKLAIKMPVLIDYRTDFLDLHKGTVELLGIVKFGMIKIGWGSGSEGIECNRRSYWNIKKNCKLIFYGNAHFAKGASLRADNNGVIVFGENFAANQNFFCATNTRITFGNHVLMGWNVHVRDGDGHHILNESNVVINENKPITIGDHVWISSYASILKGVEINNDCIIGYSAIVTKSFVEQNVIITGIPAVIVKRNINWKK